MKFSVVLTIAGAVAVTAVDIPADFPPCAKNCGDNMNALAPSLGCQATDASCLCKNVNYGYGVRDCSIQSCLNDTAANIAITWVNKLCTDAGVTLNLPPSSGSGSGGSGSGSGGSGSGSGGSGSGSGGGATGTPITTSSVVVTVTSGGSTFESTSLTTIYSAGGAGASSSPTGGEGSSTAITTSAFTSVVTSGSVVSTLTGLTTIFGTIPQTTSTGASTTSTGPVTGTALSSALTSQASASASKASSSSSSAPGCQMTAAPMAGFIAAAGLAAAFL